MKHGKNCNLFIITAQTKNMLMLKQTLLKYLDQNKKPHTSDNNSENFNQDKVFEHLECNCHSLQLILYSLLQKTVHSATYTQ